VVLDEFPDLGEMKRKLRESVVGKGSSDDVSLTGNYDEDFRRVVKVLSDSDGMVCVDGLARSERRALRRRAKDNGFNFVFTERVYAEGDDPVCFGVRDGDEDDFEEFVDGLEF